MTKQIATKKESRPGIIQETAHNMFQGFTFGSGSALGHRAISAIFDSSSSQAQQTQQQSSEISPTIPIECKELLEAFQKCVKYNDYDNCKEIFKSYQSCSTNNK
jgi:hypothetical protein